jgi:RHS repeat-associated protein
MPPPSYTPVEATVQYKDTTSGQLLKTVTKNWFDQYQESCEVDTLPSSSQSAAKFNTYTVDSFTPSGSSFPSYIFQMTDSKEYDYGLVGPSSCYPAPKNAISGNTYSLAPASPIATRETAIQYNNMNSLLNGGFVADAPSSVQVYGNGVLASETDITYDENNPMSPLTFAPTKHDDQHYPSSVSSPRGNPTTITKKCWPSCADSSAHYNWDKTGQLASFKDSLGNVTSFSHQDNFVGGENPGTNAYLTSITPPTASGVSHTSSYQYDYATGELRVATDPNQQQTQYQYVDSLNRLTEIDGPPDPNNGNQRPVAKYSYDDSGSSPSITTSQLLNTSGAWKTTVAKMDGMWHEIQSQLTSDPYGTDYTDTTYDGFGRVFKVSNPYRSTLNGITTFAYDALGRKVETQEQDGSILLNCYDGVPPPSLPFSAASNCSPLISSSTVPGSITGTWVDSNDESGNHWQRASDAFGRLTQVMEPNGASQAPTMKTTYKYDVLNDLLSVTQNGVSGTETARSRNFSYDSLSRLTQSYNPETGWVCYGTTGGVAANGSNCTSGYDANGNLTAKTDARGITVNYSYDNLNRLYQKTYSAGGVSTNDPTACMQYDVPGSAASDLYPIGRLTMEWTQTAGSTCSGPNHALNAPPTSAITSAILSHDMMGRLKGEQQCPLTASCTTPYPFSYSYDLAGDVILANNGIPSTSTTQPPLSWMSVYNGAGELDHTTVQSQPAAWSASTYLSAPTLLQANATSGYDPLGHLVNASLGISSANTNGAVTIARQYDPRGRMTSETDGGEITSGSSYATGTFSFSGTEQSIPPSDSTATLTFSGTEQLTPNSDSTATLTFSGTEQTTGYATATLTFSGALISGMNGEFVVTIGTGRTSCNNVGLSFGAGATPSSLAATLAPLLTCGGLISATASGAVVTLKATTPGADGNYSLSATLAGCNCSQSNPTTGLSLTASGSSMTGGSGFAQATFTFAGTEQSSVSGSTTTYDSGTFTAEINGVCNPNVAYGQGATPASLATLLASEINSSCSLVTATASGPVVTVTSTQAGAAYDYSIQAILQIYNYQVFSSPSFTMMASVSAMAGGSAVTYDSGSWDLNIGSSCSFQAAQGSYLIPYGAGSTPSSLAAALAADINSTCSQVTATASGAVVTVSSTTPGATSDYSISASLFSFNRGSFTSPSFTLTPSGSTMTGGGTLGYDTGTYQVAISSSQGACTPSVPYGQGSTAASLAATLATNINSSCWSLVSASNTSGSPVVTITSAAPGAGSNYGIQASMTGGINSNFPNGSFTLTPSGPIMTGGVATLTYDSGTYQVVISSSQGTCSPSVPYGQGSIPASLATALAESLNISCSSLVTATSSGAAVTVTSTEPGAAFDYALQPLLSGYDHQYFSSPSFTLTDSGGNMAGGATGGTSSSKTIYSFTAVGGYDGVGNLTNSTDSVMGKWNFTYDYLNRLLTGTPQSSSYVNPYANQYACWAYDSFGNRKAQNVQTSACSTPETSVPASVNYSASNRVTWVQNTAPAGFQYDGAGNVQYDGVNYYAYDGEGRLCAVENTLLQAYTQYVYDASGARVAKGSISALPATGQTCAAPTSPGFTLTNQYLLGQGGEQVTELNGSGAWQHSNVWAGGRLLASYNGYGLHFPLTDPLGSRRVQANAAGAADETCLSMPYGDALSCSGDDATEHHFTGKERDSESGNDYFGARYYSSAMGRFMSPDWSAKAEPVPYAKLDNPQSLNLYAYVGNNPLNVTDPDGHCDWCQKLKNLLFDRTHQWKTNAEMIEYRRAVIIFHTTNQAGTDWALAASDKQVNLAYKYITNESFREKMDALYPPAVTVASMLGANGAQVTSKTLWQNGKTERIDVENPAPGKRPGQIHYHDANDTKYLYDTNTGQFSGLSANQSKELLNDPKVQDAIAQGMRTLGEP